LLEEKRFADEKRRTMPDMPIGTEMPSPTMPTAWLSGSRSTAHRMEL
jgi:hypothetical protein